MRYYAKYNENGDVFMIGTGLGGIEITEAEYHTLDHEMQTKVDLVSRLYAEEITIEDVPERWRDEIQRKVDEIIAYMATIGEQDISDTEALDIILGGEA